MKASSNPLLQKRSSPTFELDKLTAPTVFAKHKGQTTEQIRDLRRQQSAQEALAGWDKTIELHGLTKAQFSLIDLLRTLLIDHLGPAEMFISIWTAANTDITTVLEFVDAKMVTGARWLVDLTFQRRSPGLAKRIRDAFGPDAIRVGKNHAKFTILRNDDYQVIVNTSMNLNFNPRFENFTVQHNPELCQFYWDIADEIWSKQSRGQADQTPYKIEKHWAKDL